MATTLDPPVGAKLAPRVRWENASELLVSVGGFSHSQIVSGDPADRLPLADWCEEYHSETGYPSLAWMARHQRRAVAAIRTAFRGPTVAGWFAGVQRDQRDQRGALGIADLVGFCAHYCHPSRGGWATDAKILFRVRAEKDRAAILAAAHRPEEDGLNRLNRWARMLGVADRTVYGAARLDPTPREAYYDDSPPRPSAPRCRIEGGGESAWVQTRYLALLRRLFPAAKWYFHEPDRPLTLVESGDVVAIVMPVPC